MNSKADWDLKEIDKYVVVNKILGKGNQATVYEAYRKENLQQVAAKVFDLTQNTDNNQAKTIQRQIVIQTSIKHPYILECYDVKKTQKNIYFFLEFCDGGDLEKYLKENKFISEAECIDFFKQIVSAFQMLEKHNIVHRDLKPANILLKNGQLKIADFGFAKEINNDVKNTIVGSPIFMCPQALDGSGKYDLKKGDVWSAGVCLYLMLYSNYPFYAQNIQNLIETLKQQKLIFRDDLFQRSDAVKDLLNHMLEKDENKRYTWDQIANHKCMTAGSHYQNNPLLGSLEVNQVSGISTFNSDLKNVQPKQQTDQKIQNDEQTQTIKNLEQNGQQPYKRRDNILQMKQIHCILRLQSQFALIYRIIWKGQFQLLQSSQDLVNYNDETVRNAIFLLINSLLLKEHKFLRDLIQDPQQCVKFRIKKHNIQDITEEDMNQYFNSEIFYSFLVNLQQTFQNDTQLSLRNYSEHFQAHLIAAGFKENMSEDKCNTFIDMSLGILNQKLKQMSDEAVNKENKTFIILILYLFFLQNREKRLQDFQDPIDHYQKLLKELETINFMSKQQIYDKIQQYIQTDISQSNNDMDEEEDDDIEEEEEDQETQRYI